MRKLVVVLLTMLFLVGIATSAYAASEQLNGPVRTDGASDYNPYPKYEFVPGYGDTMDNDLDYYNANSSGEYINTNDGTRVNDVIKSDGMRDTAQSTTSTTQRTHGEYKNNTNSCASCHQTHTGAAAGLLIKDSVFTTCTACHDGTLGFYNVFTESSAGTFGGTKAGNASVHMADGSFEHKYAPGGNLALVDTDNGGWTELFDCASCHAPHGSYSDRLLHYNPNDMADTPIANGGQKLVDAPVYDFANIPTASSSSDDLIVVRALANQVGLDTIETGTTPVITIMKKAETKSATYPPISSWSYVRDTTPWYWGYEFDQYHVNRTYFTSLYNDNLPVDDAVYFQKQMTKITFNYGKGYAKTGGTAAQANIGDIANATKASIGRCYVVKLGNAAYPMTPDASAPVGYTVFKVNPQVYDETGIGTPIGKYCGACHTDYRAASGGETGMYTVAYRHTTNNDSYTCLKCHYAHGTDVTIMKDAKDQNLASLTLAGVPDADAKAYLLDKNPSSALKRYTNMAVCWKCHTSSKSEELKQNTYYWDNWKVNNGGTVPEGPSNW